jgi:hypothetical protein
VFEKEPVKIEVMTAVVIYAIDLPSGDWVLNCAFTQEVGQAKMLGLL